MIKANIDIHMDNRKFGVSLLHGPSFMLYAVK